jgi:cytochrome bd ubiquinol oxidase subunit II
LPRVIVRLVWVVGSVFAGSVILIPSLGLLFRLMLKGGLRSDGVSAARPTGAAAQRTKGRAAVDVGPLVRAAVACLITGSALPNIADADWAHAVGIICLLGFLLLGLSAITYTAISRDTAGT